MDAQPIKQEEMELQMQPPPGFTQKVISDGLGKEAANINPEDENTKTCNKNAKEVAAADDDDDNLSESQPRTIEVPDPDFYDFDRDRTEESLAVDQVWAVHDDLDAMPRLYALIRRVYSPFEVKIIWLDFVSDNKNETAWDTSGLPVACGKFKHGDTATLERIDAFSHRIVCEKDGRNNYKIYPRRGEIWALFKNWSIKWSTDPGNHREYEYEFVEVLSDYAEDTGITVAYLVKIEGFVCMFKPVTIINGMAIIQIPPDELLRFSHMVPSFRTTGKEREDVPEGYFELDPASLPSAVLEEVSDVVVAAARIPAAAPCSTANTCELPESELYVFDVDKSPDKFQTGQVWALSGESDSLPKYYARINKVEARPNFKVHIQWLEASTPPKDVIRFFDNKMPTCCGLFSSGETAEFEETARFSHLAKGAVARTRTKYEVYPREGEVWAIYREFGSELSPSDLQTCQYDVGKVVKVNTLNGAIKVLVLEKVSGYVTVFKDQRKAGREHIMEIPHRELLRFSHQIPAFPLTDAKEGSLRGCLKLDVDAMPVSLFYSDSSTFCKKTAFSNQDATKETGTNGVGTNPDIVAEQSSRGPSHLDHYEIRKRSPQSCKSKKRKNPEEKNTIDGGRKSTGDNSSTRFAGVFHEKRAEGASGRPLEQMQIPSPPAHLKTPIIPETVFCNFNDKRSYEKIKTGQIWALYCKFDDMPKCYARIESVELFPVFKLTIKWLESCHPPRGVVSWVDKGMPVCCGTFKVASGEGVVFNNSISFCHQLSVVPSSNNLYTIYPRAGEVWALYKKLCSDLTCSDLKICEYYMVEILEFVDDRWIIVSVLRSVTGFKTVFRAKEREALDSITAIPWIELYRFSHRVPCFMLKEAIYGELRGCWELDPRSMPVHLYSSN